MSDQPKMDITQLTGRFSRHALARPNYVYYLWRYVANGHRTGRALIGRTGDAGVRAIARELRSEGIATGAADRFLTDESRRALGAAAARVLERSRSEEVEAVVRATAGELERQKDFLVHLVSYADGVEADDPLLQVALDRKLLAIVASYLGLWPCLHSIGAWLNYPTDAPPELSQLWHRDPEDLQLIKVFIYLVDVDEQCGPFTYIPRTHPFGVDAATSDKLERKKRMPDERMTRFFAPERWRVCTGPANTMILADTVGYHRGGKPLVGRRVLITFTYTSGSPISARDLWVRGMPHWITSGIQKSAVRPLLAAPQSSGKHGSKKKKKRFES
jgi:hypothetical protein